MDSTSGSAKHGKTPFYIAREPKEKDQNFVRLVIKFVKVWNPATNELPRYSSPNNPR
jgi:hypothetical protein